MILDIIQNLGTLLVAIIAPLAVIAFAISGIMYMFSFGDEEKVSAAKKTFVFAIIGVIVAYSGKIVFNAIYRLLGGSSSF